MHNEILSNDILRYVSPFGPITYRWNGQTCSNFWLHDTLQAIASTANPVSAWLDAYFDKKSHPIPPLIFPHTPFQSRMRTALLAVPFGETRSYGELATALNTAPRALGQALGANPLPLLIPCHRIVAADGMGGFSCGLEWKRRLLTFEGIAVASGK
ncbi:MAG: methylated-DNA--[protein]-cysteine S-methyltransferase [Mariprofundaceae bacterium]